MSKKKHRITRKSLREQAERDAKDGSADEFAECLEEYVTWRIGAALYSRRLDTPSSNPHEAADYWLERLQIVVEKMNEMRCRSDGETEASY